MFVTSAYGQETTHEAAPAAEGAAHTTEAGAAAEHGVFPPFDAATFPSQLLWLAISFGLFYLFLKRVVLPRIGSILEVRRDRIAQDLDQAALLKSEADAAIAAYEQELAEAKARANVISQEARDKAKVEAEAARKRVEAELDARLAEADARIASIRDGAMRDVGAIAEETATAIVQELVGGRADRAAVAAAVKASAV